MKALIKSEPRHGIWMQEVPVPQMGHNDVLIKIKKTAICGTDVHIFNWDEWAQKNVPIGLIIGHEFVGEVVDIGIEVKDYFKLGDRVSGEGHIPCGHCRNCRAGRAHLCRRNVSVGVTRNGCFAEYLVIPATNAYPIPDTIPNSDAVILDPLGNAAHCALSYDVVGEDVLITGAGPVGLLAAVIVRHIGARHIVITDVNEYRLALAKKLGVKTVINPNKISLKEVFQNLEMKEGFDVGLEMSGNPQAFNDMITHMNHAGKIALLGFLPNKTGINWNHVIMKGLTIKGIYGRKMYDTWYKMISMLESGLKIAPVITHEFAVADYEKAFEMMSSGESGKIIMNWN